MTDRKKRWQQARELFHSCLELPVDRRAAMLEHACGDDPELRREVESLLDFHQDDRTLIALAPRTKADPEPSGRLDRYELLEKIGQGGMGVVYRARRADGMYDDEVAIKLLQRQQVGAGLERFRRERQILADLKHPAIARLLDGGTAADGRPFLVMEYVDGTPIDRYCDVNRLSLVERLRLFTRVCRAVHFAHQSLVVHRDLKPANLMVSTTGEPKLLDFGVAKLVGKDQSDLTLQDQSGGGGSPMTPDFASPEQVMGESITTGSDIYSLGVILYLLLTGHKPIRSSGLSLAEFVDTVCLREPLAPSQRALAVDTGPANEVELDGRQVAELRGFSDAVGLSRRLAGDLDRIVAMALHKKPSGRYPSSEELARDIDRHLQGLPVLAQDQTLSYRLGKFFNRYRWPSLAAALVTLLLMTLGIGLVAQRNQLLEEQAVSREVIQFLEGLFEVSNPEVHQGRSVSARELLDRGAFDMRTRFQNQPEVRSRLTSTMGRAYFKLGHLDEAEGLLEESLSIRRLLHSPSHPELKGALLNLGELRASQGRYSEALAAFEATESPAESDEALSELEFRRLLGVAHTRQMQGNYTQALALQEEALEAAQVLYGPSHERVASALLAIGDTARSQGDYATARRRLGRAREIYGEVYGDVHPTSALLDMQIGLLLEEQGQFTEAERSLRGALESQAVLYPNGHPDMAHTLNNLASVVYQLEDLDQAEELARRGLAMRRQTLTVDHPANGYSLNLLGLILHRRHRLDEAEAALREARSLYQKGLGASDVQVAGAGSNLAQLLLTLGRSEEAEREMRQALRIYRASLGPQHLQVATLLNNLAFVRKSAEDFETARDLYGEALSILENQLGPSHPRTAASAHNLAVLSLQQGRAQDAENLFRRSLAGFSASLPPGHTNLGLVRKTLAESLLAQGRTQEAESLLREALDIYRAAGQEGSALPWLAVRGILTDVLIAESRWVEARELAETDLAKALEAHGPDSQAVARARARWESLAGR